MSKPVAITEQILRFALETQPRDVPDSTLDILRLSLTDWVAVAIAGQNEPVAKIIRAQICNEAGAEQAFVFGSDTRYPSRAAALANGTISHALDYDDTHFASLGHPSVAVIPAALAVADQLGSHPKAFQHAALLGAELAVRIGTWLGRDHYRVGFHVTATAGTFGSAVAAARLLDLSPEQTHNALSLAASRASGIKAQFGAMGKPFHAGMAASNGVEVALLAHRGFVATPFALEAPQGFAATHLGFNDTSAFDTLGAEFVLDKVSHKFHACCHGTHAMIEALNELRKDPRVRPAEIRAVEVVVHPQYLNICNITAPQTGLEAKFSYRLVAALALSGYDTAKHETFNTANCKCPRLSALRDRVTVITSKQLPETATEIRLKLQQGASLSARHDLLTDIGTAARQAKLRAKVTSLLGKRAAISLWQRVASGQQLPSDWMMQNI